MKRWLSRFGPRLQQQLNIVNGAVAVGALVVALAGFLAGGTARTILVVVGAAIALTMVLVAAIRSWPEKQLRPQDIAGQDRPIGDLPSIYPRVPAIGILGAEAVGKTTLKKRLLQLPTHKKEFTQSVTFHVSPLLHDQTAYVALLDGRGDSYDAQFEIASKADIVLVLLDHNDIETNSSPNSDRLTAHHAFGIQVRDSLARRGIGLRAVHVLMNKKDLWQEAATGDQETIRSFFAAEVDLWKTAFGNEEVTCAEHSNDVPNDTAHLIEVLNTRWAALGPSTQ